MQLNKENFYEIAISISNMADILKVHQRTLRIYDEEGLLIPKRTPKNRRYYTVYDIEKGKFIQFLTRNLSLNLVGVKVILSLLEKSGVESKNYIDYINKIAKDLNMDETIQEQNIVNSLKRGRKKKPENLA